MADNFNNFNETDPEQEIPAAPTSMPEKSGRINKNSIYLPVDDPSGEEEYEETDLSTKKEIGKIKQILKIEY